MNVFHRRERIILQTLQLALWSPFCLKWSRTLDRSLISSITALFDDFDVAVGCQKNIWGYNSRSLSVAISMVLFCRDIRFVITKDKEKNQILTVTRLKSEKRCPQFERNTTVVNKYPRSVTIRQAWCTRSRRVCNAAIRAETTETPFTPLQSTWLWSCYFKVF